MTQNSKLPEGIGKIETEIEEGEIILKVFLETNSITTTSFLALLRYIEKMKFKKIDFFIEWGDYALTVIKDY